MRKYTTILSDLFILLTAIFIGYFFTLFQIAEGQDLGDRGRPPFHRVLAGKDVPTVEVFVTSWCPYCKRLELFLRSRNIQYTRYDIEADWQGQRLYWDLGGGGVPIVRIGSFVMRGFDPDAITKALDSHNGGEPNGAIK